jgi:hypothetical protein
VAVEAGSAGEGRLRGWATTTLAVLVILALGAAALVVGTVASRLIDRYVLTGRLHFAHTAWILTGLMVFRVVSAGRRVNDWANEKSIDSGRIDRPAPLHHDFPPYG